MASEGLKICTRSLAPAVEKQRPVTQVGNEHRVRRGCTRPDTAADAMMPLALVVTVTHIVGALDCLGALVMHVPYARLCGVCAVDGTRGR